jgi:exo-1,4-beta-D-glucosaminidase
MFEAFSAYRYNATGVILWMLNSAWPEMYWQLYDYYLMPNGAYYGAKKASQPYHVVYDYARHSIFVVNDRLDDKKGCSLKIRIYDNNSQLKFEKEIMTDLMANSGKEIFGLPEMNWGAPVYFLDMRLLDKEGKEIDNNFYWLSAKKDVLDYNAEVPGWYYHTPSKQYADFAALNNLPEVEVSNSIGKQVKNDFTEFSVKLENVGKYIAFFIHAKIIDNESGSTILPVLWSDNYVSLLPGETRVLTAKIKNIYLEEIEVELVVDGYNMMKK